jgi:hypothetical protein
MNPSFLPRLASAFLLALLINAASPAPLQAAPPWLQGLGQYRIVDASGRITPRANADASGRIAYRPAYPMSPLLRAKTFNYTGYPGANYGPSRRGFVEPSRYQVENPNQPARQSFFHHSR